MVECRRRLVACRVAREQGNGRIHVLLVEKREKRNSCRRVAGNAGSRGREAGVCQIADAHSGFDIASKDYRSLLKYVLMHMSEAEAAKAAAAWAPKLGTSADKLLEGLQSGKYVVKITASGASLGPGGR